MPGPFDYPLLHISLRETVIRRAPTAWEALNYFNLNYAEVEHRFIGYWLDPAIDTPSSTPSGEQTMYDVVITRNGSDTTVNPRHVNRGTLGVVAGGTWNGKTFLHIGNDRFILLDNSAITTQSTYDYNFSIIPLNSGEAVTLISR